MAGKITFIALALMLCMIAPLRAENSVQLDCPVWLPVPSQDTTIRIPVYISNDDSLGATTLGFQINSNMIFPIGIDTVGSIVPNPFSLRQLIIGRKIQVGFTTIGDIPYVPPQQGGLLVSIVCSVPAGHWELPITIDTTFVPPAGYFMYSCLIDGLVTTVFPDYQDCEPFNIYIGDCADSDGDGFGEPGVPGDDCPDDNYS